MDWDKLRVFHAVASAGSFTHAGETLNLSQSAVSRQISALEESLDVPLFHRHARGLILTEQGDLLYNTARDVFSKLAITEAQLTESRERPQGPLTVTTTISFGTLWLTPALHEFIDLYPEIQISVILDDGELDLAMREADVAIRLSPPRQPDLVQRHLLDLQFNIYASPDYLARHGTPMTPEELDHHRIIIYGDTPRPPVGSVNWLMHAGAKPDHPRRPVLRVNNLYGMYLAALSGVGIAALPNYFSKQSGGLVQILPEIKGPTVETFFVYPEELRHSMRIAVFRDFLLKRIADQNQK
jgi:DNA-binding transcriptional LysR family regulator